MRDTFFNQEECDRCRNPLRGVRTMSWFTDQTICMDCSDRETQAKLKLRSLGKNPADYEGDGRIPEEVREIVLGHK